MRRYRPALIALVLLGLALPSASDALRRKRSGLPSTAVLSMPLTGDSNRNLRSLLGSGHEQDVQADITFTPSGMVDNAPGASDQLYHVIGSPTMVPAGDLQFTTLSGGVTGFSASNHYRIDETMAGPGFSVNATRQDLPGSMHCMTFVPTTSAATVPLNSNRDPAGHGNEIVYDGANRTVIWRTYYAGFPESQATSPANIVPGNINVACWWYLSGTAYVTANAGTPGSQVLTMREPSGIGPTARKYLGYDAAGDVAFDGTIIHYLVTGGISADCYFYGMTCAQVAEREAQYVFSATGLTTTRATPATYEANGRIWQVPSGIPRVTSRGLLVEQLTINQVLQSEQTNAANGWTVSSDTVTLDQGPAGWTDLDSHAFGSITPAAYRAAAASITSGQTLTGSAWYYSPPATGNPTARLAVSQAGGTIGTCTCGRSDGGSCTPGTITATCYADFVMVDGAAPARFWVSAVTTATGTPNFYLKMGLGGSPNVTYLIGRAQIEFGSSTTVTSYISTAGTTTQRNSDVISAPWPAAADTTTRWCMGATHAPYSGTRAGFLGVAGATSAGSQYAGIQTFTTPNSLVTLNSSTFTMSTGPGANTGSRAYFACYNNAANTSVQCMDGACGTNVDPGSYSEQFTSFRLGRRYDDSYYAAGYVSNARVCNDSTLSRCR